MLNLLSYVKVYLKATQPYTSDTDSEDDCDDKLKDSNVKVPKVCILWM